MEKNLREILSALNSVDFNIFDVDSAFEESSEIPFSCTPVSDNVDIDSFDCVSIPAFSASAYVKEQSITEHDWEAFAHDIKTGNSLFWDSYDDFILADLAGTNLDFLFPFMYEHIEHIEGDQTLEEVLAEFEGWTGTPVDILSIYGDYDYGHDIFAGDFDLDVPVKIYANDDEVVVKANFPWMKSNMSEDIYPDKLNLKSVLSVLPVRVNSQEVKASFVNGEFRLEFPKEQTEATTRRKITSK